MAPHVALLDRIIKASSNPGDTVLDGCCGCASASGTAEPLCRQPIGTNLSPVAATLVESTTIIPFLAAAQRGVGEGCQAPTAAAAGCQATQVTSNETGFG